MARGRIAQHFVYDPDYAPVKDQWFMDGGVLDNGPFDHVIDAIAAMRADGPTVREIIYLEPDPGVMIKQHLADKDGEPTFVGTVWASRITIPWHTSLAMVLGELESMNAAIAEAGALVNAQEPGVLHQLKTAESALAALTGKVTYDGCLFLEGVILRWRLAEWVAMRSACEFRDLPGVTDGDRRWSWVVPPGCCGRFPGGVRLRVPWFCGPVRGSWTEMTPRQAEDRRWSWRFR